MGVADLGPDGARGKCGYNLAGKERNSGGRQGVVASGLTVNLLFFSPKFFPTTNRNGNQPRGVFCL